MIDHGILNEMTREEVSELLERLTELAHARMELIRSCNSRIELFKELVSSMDIHEYKVAHEVQVYERYQDYWKRMQGKYGKEVEETPFEDDKAAGE